MTAPTVRPNGKVYRPRLPIQAEAWSTDDGDAVVVVWGTHVFDRAAREAAEQAVERWRTDCGLRPEEYNPDLSAEPAPDWLRYVPWGGEDGDGQWLRTTERGRPCLIWWESL